MSQDSFKYRASKGLRRRRREGLCRNRIALDSCYTVSSYPSVHGRIHERNYARDHIWFDVDWITHLVLLRADVEDVQDGCDIYVDGRYCKVTARADSTES